jgi:hypothetical protein
MNASWRPVMAFAFTFLISCIVLTVCLLLLLDKAPLEDATALFMAIIPALATPLALYIGGRSYEKVRVAEATAKSEATQHAPVANVEAAYGGIESE